MVSGYNAYCRVPILRVTTYSSNTLVAGQKSVRHVGGHEWQVTDYIYYIKFYL